MCPVTDRAASIYHKNGSFFDLRQAKRGTSFLFIIYIRLLQWNGLATKSMLIHLPHVFDCLLSIFHPKILCPKKAGQVIKTRYMTRFDVCICLLLQILASRGSKEVELCSLWCRYVVSNDFPVIDVRWKCKSCLSPIVSLPVVWIWYPRRSGLANGDCSFFTQPAERVA